MFSPVIRRLVREEIRSDLESLQEDDHLSHDGPEYVLKIIRRAVGTVQMVTALLITIISGGFRLQQSADANILAVGGNLVLMAFAFALFVFLYQTDSYTFASGKKFPMIPVRVPLAPLFTVALNVAYILLISLF